MLTEINFDGIIGPTHNYAGLSRGNIASASHAGDISQPRAAALQGIEKMRHNLALGLPQAFLVPLDRPDIAWLKTTGITGGYPDGSYHPGDAVTRGQMAAYLHHLATLPT